MKDGKNMRKKLIAAMMAGVLSAGMFSTGVFAADTDLKGEVNTFIAASLSNAMEEIQKDFNKKYPDVNILLLKSFTMQTVQVHYRHRSKRAHAAISSSQQLINR